MISGKPRIPRIFAFMAIAFLFISTGGKTTAGPEETWDSCHGYKLHTEFPLKLISQKKKTVGGYTFAIAEFSLEDHGAEPLNLDGYLEDGQFFLDGYTYDFEYRGEDGAWVTNPPIPVDYVYHNHAVVTVQAGEFWSASFYVYMRGYSRPMKETRLVLRNNPQGIKNNPQGICIYSQPFPYKIAEP